MENKFYLINEDFVKKLSKNDYSNLNKEKNILEGCGIVAYCPELLTIVFENKRSNDLFCITRRYLNSILNELDRIDNGEKKYKI